MVSLLLGNCFCKSLLFRFTILDLGTYNFFLCGLCGKNINGIIINFKNHGLDKLMGNMNNNENEYC